MQTITIDFSKTDGVIKPMNAVNNGPAGSKVRGIRGNIDTYAAAHIPFARNHDASFYPGYGGEHTVDVHRIFKNFDADENDPASYVFGPTDQYIADTIEAGTKVFYRLGASIEHGYKFGTYPPKDYRKWARICEHIIRHYTEGWTDGFHYGIAYWEIWNEPDCINADGSNPCWQGTEEEFVDLYCVAATHLKKAFPHLKIGGPAFCTPWLDSFKAKFLKTVKEKNAPLDFFSFHGYANAPQGICECIAEAEKNLQTYGLGGTETILNEFNYVRGWRGDEYAYSLRNIKGLKGASFYLGCMCAGQASPLSMLMYYEARPCTWNGLFHSDTLEPLKGYYSLVPLTHWHNWARGYTPRMHRRISTAAPPPTARSAPSPSPITPKATTPPQKQVKLELTNLPTGEAVRVECYLLDEENDLQRISEEVFTADTVAKVLDLPLFTSYLIKVKPL